MYGRWQLASKFLKYYIAASNGKGHGTHSPFVFEFITNVLNDKNDYPSYSEVEDLRYRLSKDNSLLNVEDFGAGSSVSKTNQRTIASIANNAAKPKKFGQLLYRIAQHYKPSTLLELGTSLGLTTSYLAKAVPGGRVTTMEGSPEILAIAKNNFTALGLTNIQTIEGNFDVKLDQVLSSIQSSIDFAFIDGNHRLQPTIQYFEAILRKADNFSLIILDDVHWSHEMEHAWEYCKAHSSVTLSIDLFFIGVLVFRKEIKEKQHFAIRF